VDINESIARLSEQLLEWFGENVTTFASDDRLAHVKALVRGVAMAKELNRLKTDGLATIKALLRDQSAMPDDERIASLVSGLEFGAKLDATLHDELHDTDGTNKVVRLMNGIAEILDGIGSGPAVLVTLLDRPDPAVRASAGAYLLISNLMPERVVPLLREIDEKYKGRSAGFTAHWALLDRELTQKARGDNE